MGSETQEFKPFSMSRFVTLWRCEAEWEQERNRIYLWEPLHYVQDLGPEDKPRWEYEKVVFYRPKEKDWVHVNRHLMFDRAASPDVLVLQSGLCVEITGAQVVWRNDHWFIRWHGYTNSRAAELARAGLEAWKNA